MANENLKIDVNSKPVAGAVTDDAAQEIRNLRIDDTTKGLKVMLVGGSGSGTITSLSQSTGILLTPNPIISTGTIGLSTALAPMASLTGNALKFLRVTADETGVEYATSAAGGTVTSVSVVSASGVSGSVATATTTPAITISLGAITPSTVNGLEITATTGVLTISNSKTLRALKTLTLDGTDGTTMTFPTTSATIARTDTGQTFTGTNAFGIVTATTFNGNTFTAGTYTLTGQAGKTLTFNGSITLTGTDAQTYTFPTTTATLARTDAANTFTGASTASGWVLTSPTITTNIKPTSNDGAALGVTNTFEFSDLFLASGAVIGFANSNVVLTHSSGILTMGTGEMRITTPGTNTASVVTVGGAQTLTSKTLTSPTITTPSAFTTGGDITLAENTSIALDPAGSADGKYTGITITGTAGTTLAFGDLIYLAVADSRWELTDADASATGGPVLIGMCVLAAAADGSATNILLQGQIRADAKFPALTVGAPVYVGETAGAIQVAIPTGADNVIRVVGFALTADEIYFNPSQDHQITVA